jgi:hypothetical protein
MSGTDMATDAIYERPWSRPSLKLLAMRHASMAAP